MKEQELDNLNLEDIKVIDPCMGSGHILVYCFDVLMQIYECQGYTQRDAAQSILENNLFGLDIDKRAAQLAYFAIMMKARQYDRRIFSRGVNTNVYAFVESQDINRSHIKLFGVSLNDKQQNQAKNDNTYLLDKMQDSKELGSLLEIRECDWRNLSCWVEDLDVSGQMTLDAIGSDITQSKLRKIIRLCEVMAQKYHVVCTNPPYMGNASAKLATHLQENYVTVLFA